MPSLYDARMRRMRASARRIRFALALTLALGLAVMIHVSIYHHRLERIVCVASCELILNVIVPLN